MKEYVYFCKTSGRWKYEQREKGKTIRQINYARYLMEKHLGKRLNSWEHVDHINRDRTDDRIENLQVLSHKDHIAMDAIRTKDRILICRLCGIEFFRKTARTREEAKQKYAGPFCSRKCTARYRVAVQKGLMDKLPPQEFPETVYYTNKELER